MKKYSVGEIPLSSHFSQPLYLDKKFVLAAPEMPFDKSLAGVLSEWGFGEVFSEGEHFSRPGQGAAPLQGQQQDAPPGAAGRGGEGDGLDAARKLYATFEKYVRAVFDRFTARNNLDFSLIVGNFKLLLDSIRKDYRQILRIAPSSVKDEDYLVFHTMDATIVSVIIGDAMKFSDQWIMELSIAALLHEIGMLRLPPGSYLGKRPLTAEEKKLIYIHPIIAHNFLKSFEFPLAVSRAVLEHHERENGTGYPKQKTAENIHVYSKIVAVACSYTAISADRPHKEAVDSHTGMLELLKNTGKQYNEKVVRALVSSLSVYPIGLRVVLSDGRTGQVVDSTPKKPNYPVVLVQGERNPDGSPMILKTSEDGVMIVRALSRKEIRG